MKLWQKGESTDKKFEKFTIGNDPVLDIELAYYDLMGTIAHVKMLGKIGLLDKEELHQLVNALEEQVEIARKGEFVIDEGMEDCHSQIELNLTRSLGDLGKKVHAGRSRNDQVLTALKLYTRDFLEDLAKEVKSLFELLQTKSESSKEILMPGYTHMQVAMPSSFGLWFGAYAESLIDDLVLIKAAHEIANKNPLGSAAGYGNSFPLDRDFTTNEMSFADLNVNSVYAQMTRGKLEKSTAFSMSALAGTLNKFASDVCLLNGQDFGFFDLDTRFTTGSSIMPHKHNPDGFELVRARCNQIASFPYEVQLMTTNLPSGYHRDLQLLKDHFLPMMKSMKETIEMVNLMTQHLEVKKDLIENSKYNLLFTVEEVNKLVLQGTPFREAYQKVGAMVNDGTYKASKKVEHSHVGSVGNPGNERIKKSFYLVYRYFDSH